MSAVLDTHPAQPARPTRPAVPAEDAARNARVRQGIMAAGDVWRQRHPWLTQHQNAVGMTIFVLSIAGVLFDAWAYLQGWMPAWLCVPLTAVWLSLLHELEHDLIHLMYFKQQPFLYNLMMGGVWLFRPSTINPWTRRRLHMHHHKASGSESDLEERGITNGERWGLRRLLMLADSRLSVMLRPATLIETTKHYLRAEAKSKEEARQLRRANLLSYFPLGTLHYLAWHAFIVYHLVDWIAAAAGHPLNLSAQHQAWADTLDTAVVVFLGPNMLRTFCLHFVSSNMHYYGDINSANLLQQTQVWTAPWLAPLHLFCFNFGATHAIHHFVVRDPFYLRQAIAHEVYPLMRSNGVRFNDFGTFRRANRWAETQHRA